MTLNVATLDSHYAYLDALPECLVGPVMELSGASLRERVESVSAWRSALLRGEVPSAESASWLERSVVTAAITELTALGLPRYCAGQAELTDEVLLDVLAAWSAGLTSIQLRRRRQLDELRDELAQLADRRRKRPFSRAQQGATFPQESGASDSPDPTPLDDFRHQKLLEEVEQDAAAAGNATVRTNLHDGWATRVAVWAEVEAAFGALGTLCGIGWDLSAAILRAHGWKEIERLRKLLAGLPQLQDIVRSMGRMQQSDSAVAPPLESVLSAVRRATEEIESVVVPEVPHDVRGITRSGSIERMLPSEAALLTVSSLRLLWHVRRAERALLGYRVEGVSTERTSEGTEVEVQVESTKPMLQRGPIIVCLDTSGSMAGGPETVAKALVLETLRVAHAERRPCHLFAFSGPGQVREFRLALTPEGLTSLLDFLGVSFSGGTDITGPLRAALRMSTEQQWSRADLLLVSDGEFPVSTELTSALESHRHQHATRVHGLLIGSHGSHAMKSLCDPFHVFADWTALAGGAS